MDRRPAHRGATRQDAGRLQLDQRPYLQSRPAARLRRLGPARQPRLGLCRRAALLSPDRAAGRRCRRDLPRPRRQPADHRPRLARPDLRGLHRGCGADGHPAQSRLQRHDAGGRELRAAHHPERPAHQRGAGLSASGDEPQEPHGADPRPCDGDRARGQARGRRALPQRRSKRHADGGPRPQRGHPERRYGKLAAAPAALGHRSGAAPAIARHRGAACPAGRRREFARPLRAALRGAGQERRNHQREIAWPEAGRRGSEVRHRPQGHPGAQSHPHLRVLEVRRTGRQLRPAAHLHAGELQGRACSRPSTTFPA